MYLIDYCEIADGARRHDDSIGVLEYEERMKFRDCDVRTETAVYGSRQRIELGLSFRIRDCGFRSA